MWDMGDLFGSAVGGAADGWFGGGADLVSGAAGGGGGWDWGGIASTVGGIARVATPIVGAVMGANANLSAAGQQRDATAAATAAQLAALRESQALQREAAQRGIGAIRAGTTGYADTIAPLMVERPVMLPAYRGMTQADQIAREDIRRSALANLAASGLRGAGRAGIATVNDADRRFVADAAARDDNRRLSAMQTARASADSARRGLAGIRAQEGSAIANTEIGQGNRIADTAGTIGAVTAEGALSQGQIGAQQTVANAQLYGDALGTIGSVIADFGKRANTDRYSASGGWV